MEKNCTNCKYNAAVTCLNPDVMLPYSGFCTNGFQFGEITNEHAVCSKYEKKEVMTDNQLFNKVVNDILGPVKPVYLRKKVATEFLDLIDNLQKELPIPKKILANKVYTDVTLKSMTKEELIEHIRILEHNWSASEEMYANSVKNSEQIFYEQKAEIEKLKEEKDTSYHKGFSDGCAYETKIEDLAKVNEDLQKQVDTLKKDNQKLAQAGKRVCEINTTLAKTSEDAVKRGKDLQKQVDNLEHRIAYYDAVVKVMAKDILQQGKNYSNHFKSQEKALATLLTWIEETFCSEAKPNE